MQSVNIPERKQTYHEILDIFLASVKNNSDAFLELRVQKNILRYKLSTTQKPWSSSSSSTFNWPGPCLSVPPPTHPPPSSVVPASREDQPIRQSRKKRKAAASTPSPTPDRVGDDDASANVALPTSPISDAPPEILRQERQIDFDLQVSNLSIHDDDDTEANLTSLDDDNTEADPTYGSPFETENPFAVLSDVGCDDRYTESASINDNSKMTREIIYMCYPCYFNDRKISPPYVTDPKTCFSCHDVYKGIRIESLQDWHVLYPK